MPPAALEAEAIWLASRGWQVTGADIAEQAMARAAERATASGLADRVRWVQADLSTWEPDTTYDPVTTHYAHPRFRSRSSTMASPPGWLLVAPS